MSEVISVVLYLLGCFCTDVLTKRLLPMRIALGCMRRLILEVPEEDFPEHSKKALKLIKSYEIVHLLRFEKEEFAAIIRLESKKLGAR